jgi:hypothetical protein
VQVTPSWGWILVYEYTFLFMFMIYGKYLHFLWAAGRAHSGSLGARVRLPFFKCPEMCPDSQSVTAKTKK